MPEKQRLLELALKGLEAERAKIDDEIAEIKSQLGRFRPVASREAGNRSASAQPRKRMSAAQRKRISEAMKRRHAAMNAAKTVTAPAKVSKAPVGGSLLTAAGRKKLSDLMKKRWAERRKGKGKTK